jgi:hypothetical protein
MGDQQFASKGYGLDHQKPSQPRDSTVTLYTAIAYQPGRKKAYRKRRGIERTYDRAHRDRVMGNSLPDAVSFCCRDCEDRIWKIGASINHWRRSNKL